MNITKGPMLEQYARMIDEELDVVLEWANNYVNQPGLIPTQEATEKERLESIKAFIMSRVNDPTTMRIRAALEAKRLKVAA